MKKPPSDYAARGVSSQKEGVHKAIAILDKGLYPGAFCKVLPDHLGYPSPDPLLCNVQHTDGAGTKAGLAYLAWKESKNLDLWRGVIHDSLYMNFDDVGCVGGFGPFLVSLIIDRNAHLVSDDVIAVLIEETQKVCELLTGLNIPCIYAGGETADTGDNTRTITVNNAITARFPRQHIIDASRITAPGFIVGFNSLGQATWETKPNSSIGANGLTSARHDTLSPDYRIHTETYAPETDPKLIYCGGHHLEDTLPEDSQFTIAEALLSPTRTYTPLMKRMCEEIGRQHIQALIHCSGGGQTKIGKFGPGGITYRKNDLFPLPPLFQMLQRIRKISWTQVYETYNAGHRLEAIVSSELIATECIALSRSCGIEAKIIGEVLSNKNEDKRFVEILNPEGDTETYTFEA